MNKFDAPTEQWLDYVYANRNDQTFIHPYDYVYGPGGIAMNLEITQDNLHLLLPDKVTALAMFYAEDHHCTMLEAIRFIYASPLYAQLSCSEHPRALPPVTQI